MNVLDIPKDIVHIILEYDGRIRLEKGKYINKISKNDVRYEIINPIIHKKKELCKISEIYGEFFFNKYTFYNNKLGELYYDYYFYYSKNFVVSCFYKYKNGKITIKYLDNI
jgi:hypothetical protein